MYNFSTAPSRENTNAEKYRLKERLFGTSDVLPAWVADMDLPTPPFVLEAVQKRLEHPIVGYEEFPKSAKEVQIAWIERNHGKKFATDDIFYSHSVVASMSVAIQAFSDIGDEVIYFPPIYPPFFNQIAQNDRKGVKSALIQTEDGSYRFDFDNLRRKITPKTKLLLLCNPHNPVGRSWTKEELEKLLGICKEHNIIVFSDEIHSDLVFSPNKHVPFSSLEGAKEVTINAFGVGKTFNMAGFAVSTVIIEDKSLKEHYKKTYDAIHFAEGNVLSHVAFEAAYKNGEEWLKELKAHLWHNYERLKNTLLPYNELVKPVPLEATYLAWLDCRGMGLGDKALRAWFVTKAKLGLNAGLSFGKEGSGFMRLNFAVSRMQMEEIIKRLKKALDEYQLGRV